MGWNSSGYAFCSSCHALDAVTRDAWSHHFRPSPKVMICGWNGRSLLKTLDSAIIHAFRSSTPSAASKLQSRYGIMMDIAMMQALCIPPVLRSDRMFHRCRSMSRAKMIECHQNVYCYAVHSVSPNDSSADHLRCVRKSFKSQTDGHTDGECLCSTPRLERSTEVSKLNDTQ